MPEYSSGTSTGRPASRSFGAASALVGVTPRSSPPTSARGPLPSATRPDVSLYKAGPTRHRAPAVLAQASPAPDRRPSLALVRAMKGMEPMGMVQSTSADQDTYSDGGDGADSDRAQSICSNGSNFSVKSTLSTMSGMNRDKRISQGSTGSRSQSVHMSFNDCSIEIEQQHSSQQSGKLGLCTDFQQLCRDDGQGEGFLQCLQMYGYDKPNKLQQHAIPAILQHMGKQLGGKACTTGRGKGCMVIQGPKGSGKTSSVVLALLATIDLSLPQPQAILLSGASKRDFDKYLNIFTLMDSVSFQAFMPDEDDQDIEIDEKSPKVKAARFAHILIGPPKQMLRLLSSVSSLCLDAVKALVFDDAEELLYSVPENQKVASTVGAQPKSTSRGSASSPTVRESPEVTSPSKSPPLHDEQLQKDPRSEGSKTRSSEVQTKADVCNQTAPQTLSSMPCTSPLLDDMVHICQVLECRQYSQNMSDTYRIRSGQEQGSKIRYFILMQNSKDPASRKILRFLKNTLMKKKNVSSMEDSPPPTKAIKAMKHYYAQAPHSEWVRIFAGLAQSLMFPRAVIFCDDSHIKKFYREMLDMGINVSANMPENNGPNGECNGACDARRQAVQDFTSNKSQFLITPSEPAICQIVLPKVSCMFHFGIPADMPSIYAIRLQILDTELAKDAASIFFVEGAKTGAGHMPSVVAGVGKLFDIRFLDMPFEFLPTMQTTSRPDGSSRKMKSVGAVRA